MNREFEIKHEGQFPDIIVALHFKCPKCGKETRFTAADEDPEDGSLRCVCGLNIGMTKERLSVAQSNLRSGFKSITDTAKHITRDR